MNMGSRELDVSIIVACYCEEATVEAVHRGLVSAMARQGRSYEMLFINDGSTDATMNRLLEIWERDTRVTLVDLVRNSGQWPAMTAGIERARGKVIVFMDCDLQLDPVDILPLLDRYDEGYDLVSGNRAKRQDGALRRAYSRLGNFLLRGITKGKLSDLGCALKAFNTDFVQAFQFGPMTPFRPMQVIASIDQISEIPVHHFPREHGKSKWGSAVLIPNFAFAMLDLLQGRLRTAGVLMVLIAFLLFILAGMVLLGASSYQGQYLVFGALFFAFSGMMLVIIDLLILSLVARRVRPAYIVRRVYSHAR